MGISEMMKVNDHMLQLCYLTVHKEVVEARMTMTVVVLERFRVYEEG